jgi:hypothetical protein
VQFSWNFEQPKFVRIGHRDYDDTAFKSYGLHTPSDAVSAFGRNSPSNASQAYGLQTAERRNPGLGPAGVAAAMAYLLYLAPAAPPAPPAINSVGPHTTVLRYIIMNT